MRSLILFVTIVTSLAVLPASASAASPGALTQPAGGAGCIGAPWDCGAARSMPAPPIGMAIAPDGQNVYVAGGTGASQGSVVNFQRNDTTQALSQPTGIAGCAHAVAANGCYGFVRQFDNPHGVAVSPDGKHVYVTSYDTWTSGIAVFVRGAGGALTQPDGPAGCVRQGPSDGVGCTPFGAMSGSMSPYAGPITVSPDGKHVYAALGDGLRIFTRDTTSGALTPLAGAAGCHTEVAQNGDCTDGKGLGQPSDIELSADGKSLYVAGDNLGAVAAFSRNATTGALTQLGCLSETGGECPGGRALMAPRSLAVAPDGQNVYVAVGGSAGNYGGVAILDRDTATGAISQPAGTAGCITNDGMTPYGGTCANGGWPVRSGSSVAIGPDGTNVYLGTRTMVAQYFDTVVAFARGAGGALQRLPGAEGCFVESTSVPECTPARNLRGVNALEVAPDATGVYAMAAERSAIDVFSRNSPRFSTLPPTVTTKPATAVKTTSATLNGVVNPRRQAASYWFEYGTTTAYGAKTPEVSAGDGLGDVAATRALVSLTPGTTYHFRLVAKSANGTVNGADASFRTPKPPTAVTDAVDPAKVKPTTATLPGRVTPDDATATYWFRYGRTTAYGSTTPKLTLPAGRTAVPVTANLTGLTQRAEYHYKLVAQTVHGTVEGVDRTFTTGAPPTAITGAATGVTKTSASLGGTVDPNLKATTYKFEYGTTTAYGASTAAASAGSGDAAVTVSKPLASLEPGTVYHYRLVATSSDGTAYGADRTFRAGIAPAAVTSPADPVGASTATLLGSVNPRGFATKYLFQYGTTTAYGKATLPSDPVNGLAAVPASAELTGLAEGTLYHFRIVATNAHGKVYGGDRTFRTSITPPAVETGDAKAITRQGATITGGVDPNGHQTEWWIEYGRTAAYGTTTPQRLLAAAPDPQDVEEPLTGLVPGATYHYRVVAEGPGGRVTGADRTFRTGIAPTATTLAANPVGATTATLRGDVDPRGFATTYRFEYGATTAYGRTTPASAPLNGFGDLDAAAAIDGLEEGTVYHFRVVATNAHGTAYGADQTVKTKLTPPQAVTGAAEDVGPRDATLTGTANPGGHAVRYWFEYGTSTAYDRITTDLPLAAAKTGRPVAEPLVDLEPGTTYHYRLVVERPTTAAGDGVRIVGDDRTFTTPGPPEARTLEATLDGGRVVLAGEVSSGSLETTWEFQVGSSADALNERRGGGSTSGGSGWQRVAELVEAHPGATIFFRIVARNGAGTTEGEVRSITIPRVAPTVEVLPPQNVGLRSARMLANVDPRGSVAEAKFEFERAYGCLAGAACFGGGQPSESSVIDVYWGSQLGMDFPDVGPGSSYRYRVWAENEGGRTYGEWVSFTTPRAAPEITESSAAMRDGWFAVDAFYEQNGAPVTFTVEYEFDGRSEKNGPTAIDKPVWETGHGNRARMKGIPAGALVRWRVVVTNEVGTAVTEWQQFAVPGSVAAFSVPKLLAAGSFPAAASCGAACQVTWTSTATVPGGGARAAARVVVAKGRTSLPSAGVARGKVKLTAAGRRVVKRLGRRSLRTRLETAVVTGGQRVVTRQSMTLARKVRRKRPAAPRETVDTVGR